MRIADKIALARLGESRLDCEVGRVTDVHTHRSKNIPCRKVRGTENTCGAHVKCCIYLRSYETHISHIGQLKAHKTSVESKKKPFTCTPWLPLTEISDLLRFR